MSEATAYGGFTHHNRPTAPSDERTDRIRRFHSSQADDRLAGMTRLFVAVWPPDHVIELLDDVERPRDPGVKWVPVENLHITLRFLGDADVDEVADHLDQVLLPRRPPFSVPALRRAG